MNKILDIAEIFDLKLVSLSIPVLISIIVGSIALFLFTSKRKENNVRESRNSRKIESSNELSKKKKRTANEGDSKPNSAELKKEKHLKITSSPKKQVIPSPLSNVKKNTKKTEEPQKKDPKAPLSADANEGEGWQTVSKKPKKQNEQTEVVSKEEVKTSPKKRQDRNAKPAVEKVKLSILQNTSTNAQDETERDQPIVSKDSEWIESQPKKKNKKRALRE